MPRLLRHPADREIVRLAVPAFGALVAEPAFLLTDTAIVTRLGTAPLAALAIGTAVLATIASLSIFLAYGTTGTVARLAGAGETRRALHNGVDGMWLALLIGAAAAALGIPATPALVAVFSPEREIVPLAETWLAVGWLSVPGLLVVLAATGVLRGLQDTVTPLVVAGVGFAANAALNALFVLVLDWGIAGSAWGTVLAQTAMAGVLALVVARAARRHGAPLRPDAAGIRAAARAGVPLIVRTLALRAVLLLATAAASSLGTADLAAWQVSYTIWIFLALALDALAIAGQAIVGRRLGAGDVAGARSATTRMVQWGLGAGGALALLVIAARPAYVPLFTTDPAVRDLLAGAMVAVALLQVPGGPVFVWDGVLIGAGDGPWLAGAMVVTLVVFLPAVWAVLALDLGLVGLWGAMGVFLGTRYALLWHRARGESWLVTGAVR